MHWPFAKMSVGPNHARSGEQSDDVTSSRIGY